MSAAPAERWSMRDPGRAVRNWLAIEQAHGLEFAEKLAAMLDRLLPPCPDPDMALNNLERFLTAEVARPNVGTLLDVGRHLLDTLIPLFSTSQFLSDLLINDPLALGQLDVPLRLSPTPAELRAGLQAEVDAAFEDSALLAAFRRFRSRQLLRIGANDIIRDRPLEEITKDISNVADAAVEVAWQTAQRLVARKFGHPQAADGRAATGVVLAFGKLGGKELNYSSDIDLMVVYDVEGQTDGKLAVSHAEFFARTTSEVVRLLSAHPPAYRVDLRLRPEGQRGPLARSLASTLAYYDTLGRTWERQALIKARPIAGNLELGGAFLREISPFVYRKYLGFAEINEIKALKRRIEKRTDRAGESLLDVKTGHGGIRDVEYVIQFLQLLNGGELEAVRQPNTLHAIAALAQAGCLTDQESRFLEDGYQFLREVEHRLQLLSDLQTHCLPEGTEELRRLALRMGYADAGPTLVTEEGSALRRFQSDLREKTVRNRRILNHLLHEAFRDQDPEAAPEADLILGPTPDDALLRQVLGKYRFKDLPAAYRNLTLLGQEPVPFLPTRRCRQFLANIAPQLLRALAETPDPDMALTNLEHVTASLGAKGVLWELFSFNPPSLRLYVDLCASSQFLSQILVSQPGMIDELLDSLVLNQQRTREQLDQELAELCRGAADLDAILHSFRDKELLRIGVYDILGKDPLPTTLAALSDLAEAILARVAQEEYGPLVARWGEPTLAEGPGAGTTARYVLLGLGKLGGREMSYSSDIDLVLLYEGDGSTRPSDHGRGPTANFHFFGELAQRVIHRLSKHGPRGRLYEVDMRLRPGGKSDILATPVERFRQQYAAGHAQVWERLALTRARVLFGAPELANVVSQAVAQAVYGPPWTPELIEELLHMRRRLEQSRSIRNLKRGVGGIVDIEFLVQLLQLKYGGARPEIRSANVREALQALRNAGLLPDAEAAELLKLYEFLRRVESRLRMVYNLTTDELPERPEEVERLARRLGYEPEYDVPAAEYFLIDVNRKTSRVRELFNGVVERERG
jgi:glutamate-ammonia-ligase adenylyltransferase